MNHIIGDHYDTVYGCGKCLDKVTVLGQQMSAHFKHCNGIKMKPAGPRKVSDDVAGPSDDAAAGKSRDQPKKKKKKMKSHKKSPEVLSPTDSMVSPHHSAHTVTEKLPTGTEEVRSGKHSKHGKDHGERAAKRSEDMPKKDVPLKGTPQKEKTHGKDKANSNRSHNKKT